MACLSFKCSRRAGAHNHQHLGPPKPDKMVRQNHRYHKLMLNDKSVTFHIFIKSITAGTYTLYTWHINFLQPYKFELSIPFIMWYRLRKEIADTNEVPENLNSL